MYKNLYILIGIYLSFYMANVHILFRFSIHCVFFIFFSNKPGVTAALS